MPIKPKKSLGQHFLTDRNMIEKIIRSVEVQQDQALIEIGPGTGALTAYLFQKHPNMLAIEVDDRAIDHLNQQFESLSILKGDILKISWDQLAASIENAGLQKWKKASVVGNLPYYITSPILFRLLDWSENLSEAVVMIQKEVAERIVANKKTKAYGILSVQFQLFTEVAYLFTVPPSVFSPPPKVDSAVIRIKFKDTFSLEEQQCIREVVRLAFGQRRKKLKNNLKARYTAQQLERLPYSDNIRAEELSPNDFAELTTLLKQSDSL